LKKYEKREEKIKREKGGKTKDKMDIDVKRVKLTVKGNWHEE
jgi:hypothetical protein